tara:strand:- start:22 stop:429 length:408 start_codon:yes stop_codon:yes gene_type:complete
VAIHLKRLDGEFELEVSYYGSRWPRTNQLCALHEKLLRDAGVTHPANLPEFGIISLTTSKLELRRQFSSNLSLACVDHFGPGNERLLKQPCRMEYNPRKTKELVKYYPEAQLLELGARDGTLPYGTHPITVLSLT